MGLLYDYIERTHPSHKPENTVLLKSNNDIS